MLRRLHAVPLRYHPDPAPLYGAGQRLAAVEEIEQQEPLKKVEGANMEGIILNTDRTVMQFPLGKITSADVVAAIHHPETIAYMDSVDAMEYTKADAESFLSFLEYTRTAADCLELGIFEKETESFIGMCTLENITREQAELGYWLCADYVGKGLMSECAGALMQYAKDVLKLPKIEAYVIVGHEKSIALLERLGFERKEYLEKNTENKGKIEDRFRYEKGF